MEEIRVHRTAMSSQENQKSQDETTETSTVRNLRHRLIPTTDDEALKLHEIHEMVKTEQKRHKEAEDTRMLKSQPVIYQIERGNQQVHVQIAERRAEQLKMKQQLASPTSDNLSQKRVENGSNLVLTYITVEAAGHEGVAPPEPVEAEAEDRLNVFDRTLSESSCTNTDEDSSESGSSNTDSDYDEFSVPEDLEERLNQLCADQDVADFLIHQNPEDYTDIVIEGKNANTISEEKLQTIRGERELWSRYKISTTDLVDEERIHQYMKSQIKGFSMASLEGTCELLVEMEENNNDIVASAVGPAHMMFSEEINKKLRDGIDLQEARDHIEKTPKHTKYEMHFGPNEEERTALAKCHPPMFGYRYKLSGEDNPRNAATSDESDDAEVYQAVDSPLYVSHSLCRNDMALFRLDYTQAEHMNDRLQSNIGLIAKMVDVKRMNQLKKYVRPKPDENICIRVKGQRGVLVRHTLNVERQRAKGEAYHLTFKLDDGELVKGDSGSIVFEEKHEGEMRPLGMFTGTAYIRAYNKSYYQAVILSKALEDISASYNLSPPGLQLFNASGRDRTSSGQVRHRSTTRPPTAQFGDRRYQ